MINLLPPIEKHRIWLEWKTKLILILWSFLLFFIVCCSVFFFSIRFVIQKEIESQITVLDQIKQDFKESEIQAIQDRIDASNVILTELDEFYQDKVYFTNILKDASEILPKGSYLNNFSIISFTKEEESGLEISLSGYMPTREDLFDFKNNIEGTDVFKDVYFPPTNWTKAFDINFSVKFDLKI